MAKSEDYAKYIFLTVLGLTIVNLCEYALLAYLLGRLYVLTNQAKQNADKCQFVC
jgi:hypothetical protein